jgi:IclR family pca regulon transcriptional regulator
MGLCSIAVPLENSRGRVVAALNIGAPAALVSAREMARLYLSALQYVQLALKPLLV